MRATVARSLTDRPIKKGEEVQVLNEEVLPVIRRAREVMNYDLTEQATLASAGTGAYEEIWRSPELPTSAMIGLEARVGGANDDGTVACFVVVRNAINSAGGTVSIIDPDAGDAWTTPTYTLLDARWQVDAVNRQAYLEVCDGAYAALSWKSIARVVTLEI